MKKLLIVLGIVVVLIAAAVGYAIFNINSIIVRYRPELEKVASQTLGSPVKIGSLSATVFPSAKVEARELSLGEGEMSGLSLGGLILKLKLIPLLSGNLDVVELSLDSPRMLAIKDGSAVRIAGLPQKRSTEPAATTSPERSAPSAALPSWLQLNLERLSIEAGSIRYKDAAQKLDLELDNLAVDSRFTLQKEEAALTGLKISATALGKVPLAVRADAVTLGLSTHAARISGLSAEIPGGELELEGEVNLRSGSGAVSLGSQSGLDLAALHELKTLIPALEAISIKGKASPELRIQLEKNAPSASGKVTLSEVGISKDAFSVADLAGSVPLSASTAGQRAESDNLSFKLNGAPFEVAFASELSGKSLQVSELELSGLGGSLKAPARFNLGSQDFAVTLEGADFSIEQALNTLAKNMPARVTGTIKKVKGEVGGKAGPDLMQSLKGPLNLYVADGSFPGFNLAGDVLRAVKDLPFLSGALFGAAPPAYVDQISSSDTAFRSVTGDFAVADGSINTGNLRVESVIFALDAKGRIGFDSMVDLNATITFTPEFSEGLAARAKDLRRVFDSKGRLVVPLSISGKAPKVVVLPNLKELMKTGAGAVVKEEAGKLIDKALGGKGKGPGKALGDLLGF